MPKGTIKKFRKHCTSCGEGIHHSGFCNIFDEEFVIPIFSGLVTKQQPIYKLVLCVQCMKRLMKIALDSMPEKDYRQFVTRHGVCTKPLALISTQIEANQE